MKMDMKIRRHKKFRHKSELIAGLVMIALALLIILCVNLYKKQPTPVVTLSVSSEEVYQNEALPVFTVAVTVDSERDVMLIRKDKYSLQDLVKDIENGKGYELVHSVDMAVAGSYPISLKLDKDFGDKIQVVVNDGKLLVKEFVDPNRPMVALTFDDGPGPYTIQLLEGLETNNVKATFFMLGSRVNIYPEAVKRMKEIGCEMANHSTNHMQLTTLSDEAVQAEVNSTNEAVFNVTGETPVYLRPPYGSSDDRVRGIAKMPVILWSVDTLDWQSRDVEKIKEAIRTTIKDGDIILMHDIYQTTVDAILQLIPELQEQGYQFVTVSELAANRGVEIAPGEIYRHFYKE